MHTYRTHIFMYAENAERFSSDDVQAKPSDVGPRA